jgi:hypothetical protein
MTEKTSRLADIFRRKESPMIESLLGSKNAERALIYIFARGEGHAREIARFYENDLKSIQMQLNKFEKVVFWQAARWDAPSLWELHTKGGLRAFSLRQRSIHWKTGKC